MRTKLLGISSLVVLSFLGTNAGADRIASSVERSDWAAPRQASKQAPTRNASGRGSCGLASTYGPNDTMRTKSGKVVKIGGGSSTAAGHRLDGGGLPSIATIGIPLNTVVLVTYNGKTAKACADDRGGFQKYGRSFDLGPQLSRQLGASGVKNACVQTTGGRCG